MLFDDISSEKSSFAPWLIKALASSVLLFFAAQNNGESKPAFGFAPFSSKVNTRF